ncbi:MAG: transposase [Spirochaetaceae bacterium]|jgi:transposase|nr:transposase [Spirochaetaceae bacterium]
MNIQRAFKVRLYPTAGQQVFLNKTLGSCRFLWFASSKTCHVCGYVKKDLLLREREWACPEYGARHDRDRNAAENLAELGKRIPVQRGELTSADMAALALGNKSETAVEIPATGRSRNLEEQASSPRL